jgi:hypothetical protein
MRAFTNEVQENGQNNRSKQSRDYGPLQDDPAFTAQIPAAHPGEQVKPFLFLIVCKQRHNRGYPHGTRVEIKRTSVKLN